MKSRDKNPFEAYRKTEVVTANRETILLMLYAGAIRFLKGAIKRSEEGNVGESTRLISKTQEIVNELRCSLNFEAGGEIAKNLDDLYAYITQRLIESNLDKNTQYLRDALSVLETLHSAWEQAVGSLKQKE